MALVLEPNDAAGSCVHAPLVHCAHSLNPSVPRKIEKYWFADIIFRELV